MKLFPGLTHFLLPIGLLSLLLSSSACAIRSGPLTSQVLDAQTGHPLPGAVVLGVWTTKGEGIFGAHAPTKLVGVREAETDAQGRFTLERPAGMFGEDEESITVYKFGYIAWSNQYLFPTKKLRQDAGVPARISLEVFPLAENRTTHRDFISFVTMGVGLSSRAPGFWKAVQREQSKQ